MNIADALQDNENNLYVVCGDRWLVGNGRGGWIIYERQYAQKKTRTVTEVDNEDAAIRTLLGE